MTVTYAEKYLYNKLKEKYNYLEFNILVMINYNMIYSNSYDIRINVNMKCYDILTIYRTIRYLDVDTLNMILFYIDNEMSKHEFSLFVYEFTNTEVSKL